MENQSKLPECDEWLNGISRRISPEAKTAFLSAFIAGMLTHLYMFTGKYPNHDEVLGLFSANTGDGFGRWFLRLATAFSSNSSVPLVTGIISITALALACAMVVRILRIEKRTQIIITALIMVTFPTVANTFTWMYTADGYIIGITLAVYSVYLTDRYRSGFLLAIIPVILAASIYQSCLCVIVALLATRYLQQLLEKEHTDREMLLLLGKYAAMLFGGAILYILFTRFVLPHISGEALFDHAGLDNMGSIAIADIPGSVYNAYYQFAKYMLNTSMVVSWRFVRYLHLAIGGLEIVLTLLILLRTKGKSLFQTVFAVAILLLIPVLYGSIYLMGVTDHSTYYLTIYSYTFFYILPIVLYNALRRSCEEKPLRTLCWFPNAVGYAATFLVLLAGLVYAVNSNEVYLVLQLKYENSYALSNRVVQSIEAYPAYTTDTPVYVAGAFNTGNYTGSKLTVFQSMGRHSGLQGPSEYNLIVTDKLFRLFVRDYIGVLLTSPKSEQINGILAAEALKEMPDYPYEGSIRMIDGVLVVKASD